MPPIWFIQNYDQDEFEKLEFALKSTHTAYQEII
jgi:hypothetical protein